MLMPCSRASTNMGSWLNAKNIATVHFLKTHGYNRQYTHNKLDISCWRITLETLQGHLYFYIQKETQGLGVDQDTKVCTTIFETPKTHTINIH